MKDTLKLKTNVSRGDRIYSKKRNERIFISLMLLWPLLHFLVFWVYVNANTFYLSFFRWNTQEATYVWSGLDRFKTIIESIFVYPDANIINYLKNSAFVFVIQNGIMLPLSMILAFFLSKKVPCSSFFRIIFFLPSIVSTVVVAMAYKYMFDADFGPINLLLQKILGETPDWFNSQSELAMIMVFTFTIWSGLGYKMLLLQGSIERIPQEIIEVGRLEGLTLRQEFFKVTLPLVMPTITTFFVMNTLAIFSYYVHPLLLCGPSGGVNGSTGTIALYVFSKVDNGSIDGVQDGAAFGLLFSLVGIPVILFIKWFLEKLTPDVEF